MRYIRKEKEKTVINKYIQIYHKRNVLLALFCSVIVFIPLFVAALLNDAVPHDIWLSLVPFLIAAVYVAAAASTTVRFRRMIEAQEERYGVTFGDHGAIRLEMTLFLSDEWLIRAGVSAIYKDHVQSVKSSLRRGRSGSSNRVVIGTVDGKKYVVWCQSSSGVRKIKAWKNGK